MDPSSLPPLHPGLVHFPIALVTISFVADLLARISHSASLRTAAWWMLIFGLISALISVPLGYFDMNRATLDPMTHDYVDVHLKIGWILVLSVMLLTLRRAHFRSHPEKWVGSGYLFTAFLVTGLVLFQGWFGGEMVYAQGAGVSATGQGTKSWSAAQRPLAKVRRALVRIPGFGYDGAPHGESGANEPAGADHFANPSHGHHESEQHH